MKTRIILFMLMILSFGPNLSAQYHREFTTSSVCYSSGFKSAFADYNLGYEYRQRDSSLVISGYLGLENCAIIHNFKAVADSNKIVLSEEIVDTLLATCMCYTKMKIEIDSFYFEEFTVEFNGQYLTDIPPVKHEDKFNIYPNPANDILYLDISDVPKSARIDITDTYGRVLKSCKNTGDIPLQVDISGFSPGIYFARISEVNLYSLFIKN